MFQIEKKGSDKMTTWDLIFIIVGILCVIQMICNTIIKLEMMKHYYKEEKHDNE